MVFINILNSRGMGIFLAIIFVIVVILVLSILCGIDSYISNKNKKMKLEIERMNSMPTEPTAYEAMNNRLDATTKFLDLIVTMIESEVNAVTFSNMVLKQPYEINRMDSDIKRISENVYNGIRSDFFADPNNTLTPEYLMGTITKFTSTMMVNKCAEINRALREEKVLQ